MGHDFIRLVPYHGKEQTKRAFCRTSFQLDGKHHVQESLGDILPGGRPANNWYKCKKSATYDVVIMGFTEGQGKFVNGIGARRLWSVPQRQLTEMGQTSA